MAIESSEYAINIIGRGVTDPHIKIFNDRAYLYASHDSSRDNSWFVMPDWQIWSSDDLLNWKHECTLSPEDTYIGKKFNGCWATDVAYKNGKYHWVFSEVDKQADKHQIGLVISDQPTGPWADPLGRPLLGNGCVETEVYDPCLYQEANGDTYILFGVWDYYIAKLSDDLLSLAERPKKLVIRNPTGPYGEGKTDDKVFLHQANNLYYLSWGAYYATSENLYGPYEYKGCIVDPQKMEEPFRSTTWPHGPTQGRHGSFFEWRNQWFFAYCEMCFSGSRYYRDFWISYVQYTDEGEIIPININRNAATILQPK